MKASTKKKISRALKRYHACARRGGCGRKKKRVALTRVAAAGKKGRLRKRAASKGQQTAAKMLRALEKKAADYDKRYRSIAF